MLKNFSIDVSSSDSIFMTEFVFMNLTSVPIGKSVKVVSVSGSSPITKRLMEMGVVPGVFVRVVKSAPFGDPLEIRVRGYNLAMRKSEAQTIEVE